MSSSTGQTGADTREFTSWLLPCLNSPTTSTRTAGSASRSLVRPSRAVRSGRCGRRGLGRDLDELDRLGHGHVVPLLATARRAGFTAEGPVASPPLLGWATGPWVGLSLMRVLSSSDRDTGTRPWPEPSRRSAEVDVHVVVDQVALVDPGVTAEAAVTAGPPAPPAPPSPPSSPSVRASSPPSPRSPPSPPAPPDPPSPPSASPPSPVSMSCVMSVSLSWVTGRLVAVAERGGGDVLPVAEVVVAAAADGGGLADARGRAAVAGADVAGVGLVAVALLQHAAVVHVPGVDRRVDQLLSSMLTLPSPWVTSLLSMSISCWTSLPMICWLNELSSMLFVMLLTVVNSWKLLTSWVRYSW